MATLLFYPAFPDPQSMMDQVFRTIWHFAPMADRLDSIVLPYGGDAADIDIESVLTNPASHLSPDFDPDIAHLAIKFNGKFEVSDSAVSDMRDLAGVLVWNTSDAASVQAAQRLARNHKADVVLVDPLRRQQETLETIRFAYSLWTTDELTSLVETSYQAFCEFADRWNGRKISAFGKGPSLGQTIDRQEDLGDSVAAI